MINKYITTLKRRFQGFSKSLEECYEQIQIDNNTKKKANFFDTSS